MVWSSLPAATSSLSRQIDTDHIGPPCPSSVVLLMMSPDSSCCCRGKHGTQRPIIRQKKRKTYPPGPGPSNFPDRHHRLGEERSNRNHEALTRGRIALGICDQPWVANTYYMLVISLAMGNAELECFIGSKRDFSSSRFVQV